MAIQIIAENINDVMFSYMEKKSADINMQVIEITN